MDDAAFQAVMASLDKDPPRPAVQPSGETHRPPPLDDAAFNTVMASMEPVPPTGTAPQPQAPQQPAPAAAPNAPPPGETPNPDGTYESDRLQDNIQDMADGTIKPPQAAREPGLSDPSAPFVEAPVQGFAKAVYETKDFIAGETPKDQRSNIRKAIEAGPNQDNAGLGYSLSSGVAQFATGMLGAGKIVSGVKALSATARVGYEALHAVRGGKWALETAKAAGVGAAAFDPHEERLSNLIQSYPSLANPITAYLAAKPGDSAAEGRLKNAIESVGMGEVAMAGMAGAKWAFGKTLIGSLKLYKAIKSGDQAAIEAASRETQSALDSQHPEAPTAPPAAVGEEHSAAPAEAAPEAAAPTPAAVGEDHLAGAPAPAAGEAPRAPEAHAEPATVEPPAATAKVLPDGSTDLGELDISKPADQQPPVPTRPPATLPTEIVHDAAPDGAGSKTLRDGSAVPGDLPSSPPAPEVHTDGAGRTFEKAKPGSPWLYKPALEEELSAGARETAAATGDEAGGPWRRKPASEEEGLREGEGGSQAGSASDGTAQSSAPNPQQRLVDISGAEADSIYHGALSDVEAFIKHGTWDDAVSNGHIFGKGGSIPWQKFAQDTPAFDAFVSRSADALKDRLDRLKGVGVYTDNFADSLVEQRVKLYGEDPGNILGLIERAGKDANALVANMETSYLISQRAFQDAYVLAGKIKIGALDEFGGLHEAAMEQLRQTLQVANTAQGAGQSMRAAFGRGMRRLRGEFRQSGEMMEALKSIDGGHLVNLLETTGGDPRALKYAMQPTLLRRVTDAAQFFYVNNLLWGLRTHFVNFSANGYMLMARPLERILGSLWQSKVAGEEAAADALRIRQEALRQYHFMAGSLRESWKAAVETWRLGDSVLTPHEHEALRGGVQSPGLRTDWGIYSAQAQLKPFDSIPNMLHNAFLVAAPKVFGAPTRAMGTVDELVKQVVYRSKVQARSFVEGKMQGLDDDALRLYVKNRLYDSFDNAGRAIDADALREAQVSTFQQKLEPGTFGKAVQDATASVPFLRFIIPFVKTPTNVLRMGWKMTPGLNALQSEFRAEFSGAMGAERQAQAIGQASMGTLFAAYASWMAYEGRVTGGGPSDPQAQAALKATGWQPYSFVSVHNDGSRTYTNFGRYDPVAMPFGIAADIVSTMAMPGDSSYLQRVGGLPQALLMGLVKNITSKTYLKSMDDTIQLLEDPDKNAAKTLGTFSANMVPGSSGFRFVNQTMMDPVLRDSRAYTDYIMATLPGFSQDVRPKRDMFGDILSAHPGLWVDSSSSKVDAEIRRMAERPGDPERFGPPSAKFKGGVDLRDVTMVDGKNAFDVLQERARQPSPNAPVLKDQVAKVMDMPAYQKAPDGDAKTPGTKMAIIANVLSHYRHAAENSMLADKNVRDAAYKHVREVQAAYANRAGQQNPTAANAQGAAKSSLIGGLTRMVSPMLGKGGV